MKRISPLRNIIFLFIFSVCINGAFAQGNLQFNQAIKLELVGTHLTTGTFNYVQIATQTVIVPAGKVWKLESASVNVTKGALTTSTYSLLWTAGNGVPVLYWDDTIIFTNSTTPQVPHQIYWFPAGTYDVSMWASAVNPGQERSMTGLITAIEFNVVP